MSPQTQPEVIAAPDCPVCGAGLAATSGLTYCARCGTPHHADCFQYNGRCAVYGCSSNTGAAAPLALDGAELVIVEEPGDTERMFIPVASTNAEGQQRVLSAGFALAVGIVATASLGSLKLGALVAGVGFALGTRLRSRQQRATWEVDGTKLELALVLRTATGVERTVYENLDKVQAVVIRRMDVVSVPQSDHSGRYRSAWTLDLRWAGRTRELTAPEWVDGHAEPPRTITELGRRLARLLAKPLEIDPPAESKLPPGMGQLPSHS